MTRSARVAILQEEGPTQNAPTRNKIIVPSVLNNFFKYLFSTSIFFKLIQNCFNIQFKW